MTEIVNKMIAQGLAKKPKPEPVHVTRVYTCQVCGERFTSHNRNPKYCSKDCKDGSQVGVIPRQFKKP